MPDRHDRSWSRFYVPEIHDVHPGMEDVWETLLNVWPRAARDKLALLVVPNWMGEGLVGTAPDFAGRISATPGLKVLHGWTHTLGPDFWNWLFYGHDNRSEFASLDDSEAERRLSAGMDELRTSLGEAPAWFCAPRWQQSAAVPGVLRRIGFRGYMLRSELVSFDGPRVPLHALCFDEGPRKPKAAIARVLREGSIRRLMTGGTPFRVTLHPDDVADGATWRQVERLMKRLNSEGWEAVSVEEAVQRWRSAQRRGQAA